MANNLKVGQEYQAKSYHESGYNFPEGKYKIKVQMEGFPQKSINSEKELEVAKQQWLEGLDEEDYDNIYNSIWYYLELPDGHYEWIPESVAEEVLY